MNILFLVTVFYSTYPVHPNTAFINFFRASDILILRNAFLKVDIGKKLLIESKTNKKFLGVEVNMCANNLEG